MPQIKERNQNDKIKKPGKAQQSKGVLRIMTAKLRKNMAQHGQQGEEHTADTQAVEQSTRVGTFATREIGNRVERVAERMIHPSRHPKTRKGKIKGDGYIPKFGTSELPPAVDTPEHGIAVNSNTLGETAGGPQHPYITKKEHSLKNQSINPSIKERPRHSFGPKEKPPGGVFTPKTRKSIEKFAPGTAKTAKTTVRKTVRTPTAKRAMEQARRKAQVAAQRNMLQKTRQAAKAAAELSRKAAIAVTKAVAALVSALVSLVGGVVLVAALAVMALIAALLASPFGIFFSNEPSKDAVPLNVAIAQINMEVADKLEDLQDGEYDSIDIQGQPPAWKEVVAVFAVKTAGGDNSVDVAALTSDRVERLRAVFWDMCEITTEVETIEHKESTETILHITITPKTAEDMRTAYALTAFQNQTLTELLEELDALDGLLGDLAITQVDAVELLQNLPKDLSPKRRAVVETACKLVGKVNYFWGGKSLVIGWDSRWGQLTKVWADGSSTTGTYRPYGLDCSGFVDWTFYNVSNGEYVMGHGGGAQSQHSYCTSISWDKAQPGDLVFYSDDSHVGIVGGWDAGGNLLIVHCTPSGGVVITGLENFTAIGRPPYYGE